MRKIYENMDFFDLYFPIKGGSGFFFTLIFQYKDSIKNSKSKKVRVK